MNFTQIIKYSATCAWSPNGNLVANVLESVLYLRDSSTFQVLRAYRCLGLITTFSFSPDGNFILTLVPSLSLVQVWHVEEETFLATIKEGIYGLTSALWCGDSTHIITATDYRLRLTVWSLQRQRVCCLAFPKFTNNKGITFSTVGPGRYMLTLERREYKDYAVLYYTPTWQLLKEWEVDTEDCTEVLWSPDDSCIAFIDSHRDYNVVIYSLDGHKIAQYKPPDPYSTLGIKAASWSPSGRLFALGDYQQRSIVFTHLTWRSVAEFIHLPKLELNSNLFLLQQFKKKMSLQQQPQNITSPEKKALQEFQKTLKNKNKENNKIKKSQSQELLEESTEELSILSMMDNFTNFPTPFLDLRETVIYKEQEVNLDALLLNNNSNNSNNKDQTFRPLSLLSHTPTPVFNESNEEKMSATDTEGQPMEDESEGLHDIKETDTEDESTHEEEVKRRSLTPNLKKNEDSKYYSLPSSFRKKQTKSPQPSLPNFNPPSSSSPSTSTSPRPRTLGGKLIPPQKTAIRSGGMGVFSRRASESGPSGKFKSSSGSSGSSMGPPSNRTSNSNVQMKTFAPVDRRLPPPTKYIPENLPVSIAQVKSSFNSEQSHVPLGVGLLKWSYDERYLLTRNDNMPSTLWIWDTKTLTLSTVLKQKKNVRVACWAPSTHQLAISTGHGKLYMWSPTGCSIIDVPAANFVISEILWHPRNVSLLLLDPQNRYCCCFLK